MFASGCGFDNRGTLAPAKPAQRQRSDVTTTAQGRNKFRPEGNDNKNRQPFNTLDNQVEKLLCRRIGPVDILVDRQNRPLCSQASYLVKEHSESPLLLRIGRQIERWVAPSCGE